jgi:hypothetical protein
VANQWQHCTLDDDSLQQFMLYKQELHTVETEILALENTMKDQIADLNRTTKVVATLTTKGDGSHHRLQLTAVAPGTDIHKYKLIIVNPGPDLNFNPSLPNLNLRICPSMYGVVPTDPVDKLCYESNVIYVEVATDETGVIQTTADRLRLGFLAGGYGALFTSVAIDGSPSLAVVADGTQYTFSGGKDTPLKDLTNGFNDLYAGTGKDIYTALEQLNLPVAKPGQSPAEVLSQTSDLIPLSTGKLVKCSGENLVSLRAMWGLMGGGDADAAELVCSQLPGKSGYPLVVWMRQVTATVEVAACDGGGFRTTITPTMIGKVNERPVQTLGLTPYVFWLEKIAPSVETLKTLSYAGLSTTQVQTALDDSDDTVYVIPEPQILTTYDLTCAELLELFQLTCEGVSSISVAESLGRLPVASPANGFVSSAFNLPGGSSGIDIRGALSPETSMADELAALSQTKCIDPFAVGSITSLIASASAMIDMATGTVERVRGLVMGTLNTISGLVANIQSILSMAEKLGCLIPLDFMASVKAPALDSFLLPQIDLAIPQINGLLDTVQAIMEKVNKIICQVVSAINTLLGMALSGAECLVPGITNAIANAISKLLPNPLDMLPCIENPFDLVGLFQGLLGKISALSDLVVSMVNDILSIASQLQLSINIKDQTAVKEATGDCSSGPLGAIAKSIKSKLSV